MFFAMLCCKYSQQQETESQDTSKCITKSITVFECSIVDQLGYRKYNPFLWHPIVFFCRSILAFIMIPLMQQQLDEFRDTIWNSHRIRAQNHTLMADGVPNHIFAFPERYNMKSLGNNCLISSITVLLF